MRFAFFDAKPYDLPGFRKYGAKSDVSFKFLETRLNEDTAGLAHGSDGVCCFVNDTVNAPVIDELVRGGCGILALRCAGFNNVDLMYAKDRLRVVRVPAYSPHAVAEHAMAMLLTIVRRTHKAYIRTKDFNFSLNGLTGFDLYGKTAGVVGTGKIGRAFIDLCRGFGMRVLAYDKFPGEAVGFSYVSLEELLRESDIVSLHCPLTEETYHLIDGESLFTMKKGVILVNTSRGALLDTEALIEGIKARQVGAACLDVYEEESDVFFEDFSGHIVEDDTLARLLSLPNVLVTSHQAFLTREALDNIAEATVNNIAALRDTGICPNEIGFPAREKLIRA